MGDPTNFLRRGLTVLAGLLALILFLLVWDTEMLTRFAGALAIATIALLVSLLWTHKGGTNQ